MKNKIIGFVFGVLSLGIVNAASATELKLATFEPPKAFIASKILAAWADKVNECSAGAVNVKMFAVLPGCLSSIYCITFCLCSYAISLSTSASKLPSK